MSRPLSILFIGDVVGKAGRKAVIQLVPQLRSELQLDAVFLNAENIAHGRGITTSTITELIDAGVDFFTSGNHIWDNAEGVNYLKSPNAKVLRPENFPLNNIGQGFAELIINGYKILLINLLGQVFISKPNISNPFITLDGVLKNRLLKDYAAIIVDFHAEATSEKQALAWYVDGRVSLIAGTHTHVPTADLRLLPNGTGLVCDLGYVGAKDSVLGFNPQQVVDRFINNTKRSLEPIETGKSLFNSVLATINPATGLPLRLERIDREIEL